MRMKKRLSRVLLTCFLINLSISAAHAAPLDAQIADFVTKSTEINTTVQQFKQIQQAVETGSQQKVLGALASVALTKVQQSYNLPAFTGGNMQETVTQAAQQVIEQKVQAKIMERVAPYQNIVNSLGLLTQLQGKLNPIANQQNNSLAGAPENYRQVLSMTATAYAPGYADNGHWGDKTYIGTLVRQGVVAVDPQVIPMGTKLWVEGYGYATAEDQGSAIKGNRIDLAYNDFKTASDYGIKDVKVYVLK